MADFAVAVDIGGTFTDIALHERASGMVWRAKTPSVPADPSVAFMTGVRLALEQAGVEVEFRAWVGVGVEEWAQVFRPGEAAVLAEGWAQAALAA